MTVRGWHGWALILAVVAAVDLLAAIRGNDETLSSAQYRARQRHPLLVRFAIVATAYHLLAGDDDRGKRLDVFQLGIAAVRQTRRHASSAATAALIPARDPERGSATRMEGSNDPLS